MEDIIGPSPGEITKANQAETNKMRGTNENKSQNHTHEYLQARPPPPDCTHWDGCPSICTNSVPFGSSKPWNEKGISGSCMNAPASKVCHRLLEAGSAE